MSNQLTALDATFLELEEVDSGAHMHIGGVLTFEPGPGGGAPPIEDLRERLAARFDELPRFRQRLSEPHTGGLRWPRWVMDEFFEIERHVWTEALPDPAGERELLAWAGEYFSIRLTRERPLWEIVMTELADGRWALISKTHHCMVDGVGSIDIVQTILDAEPEPRRLARLRVGAVGSARSSTAAETPKELPARLVSAGAGATAGTLRGALGIVRGAAGAVRHPSEIREAAAKAEAVADLVVGSELIAAPRTSLNVRIGERRSLAIAEVALADLKGIKNALGGTINDVVLAVTATALRWLLLDRGEDLPDQGLRAMVPVDIRGASRRLELGNEISSLFVHLPLESPDPLRRYATQRDQAERLKAGSQAQGSRALIDLSSHAPPILHSFLARSLYSTRLFNLTITNVPGPLIPLYAFGSRLRSIWPLVPLAAEHALGLAVFSYDGRLFFCFNADPAAVPELDQVAAATREAIDELLILARAA